MNPLITSALYWKGFAVKLGIDTIVIIALAMTAGLTGIDNWGALPSIKKVIIVASIVGLAGKNISSLIDQTFAKKVAEQEDATNLNAPAPLATKAENPVDREPAKP